MKVFMWMIMRIVYTFRAVSLCGCAASLMYEHELDRTA